MASADLRKELECSVCLDFYRNPVTLTCGHNFCRDCIGRVWDTQEGSGGYSCPDCKQSFKNRPVPQRNLKLRNIVENFQSAHPDQEESGVSCTYCIHTPVPAVRSCLHCDASLCDDHLRVHSKSPEHVLCDLTTSLENRKCSVHKKILEYYCTEDSSCICMSCKMDGEHRGHQVESVAVAFDTKKKKLRNVLQKLMTERQKTERRVQSLQERRRKVQGKADGETKRVTALFRDLRRRMEDLEKRVLGDISGQAEWVSIAILDIIRELEIKKDELYSKIYYIKELCNMTDPLTVLQESDTGDLCDTEDGDDEDRERRDNLLHDGGDLDVAGISHTLHTGLSDIMSGVNVEKCTGTHVYPHSTTKGKGHIHAGPSRRRPQPFPTIQPSRRFPQPTLTIQPSRPHPQPSPTIQPSSPRPQLTPTIQPSRPHPQTSPTIQPSSPHPQLTPTIQPSRPHPQPSPTIQPSSPCPQLTPTIQPSRPHSHLSPTTQHSHRQAGGPNIGGVQQTSGVTDILLDERTAGKFLYISDDRKTASWSGHIQDHPDTPERFHEDQVMSIQRFSSGRHYWEVDFRESSYWKVGMCYPSIDRRGNQTRIGSNKKSWVLEGSGNNYSATHDSKEIPLPIGVPSKRVRIVLDYEAGRISFYDLCDPFRHLHTFTTTFTEPLHAAVYVYGGDIKICGRM